MIVEQKDSIEIKFVRERSSKIVTLIQRESVSSSESDYVEIDKQGAKKLIKVLQEFVDD